MGDTPSDQVSSLRHQKITIIGNGVSLACLLEHRIIAAWAFYFLHGVWVGDCVSPLLFAFRMGTGSVGYRNGIGPNWSS